MYVSRSSEGLLRAKGAMVAARFMNWARIPNPALRDEGAVLYAEPSLPQGRLVYFAFAESSWSAHPNVAYGLIDDSIQWLQREPQLVRAAWPNAKQAANAIEMDTEQGFANATNFLSMMQGVDYPTTFYVLTSVGQQFPDLLQKLYREAEVGYHGDIHIGFKDQPESTQLERLQAMRKQMASVIADPVRINGFRAPTEGYDATTERLVHALGVRHHVADPNRSDGRLPLLAKIPGVQPADDVVVLPRTQRDDINLYWEKLSVEQTTQALIDDTELALDNAALGLLSIHTQNYAKGSVLYQAMPGYLLHIKQYKDRLWLASTGQIADWWRERERFRINSRFSGKRLEMDVSVVGKEPVKGGTVVLMLPQKNARPTVKSTKTTGYQPTLKILDAYRVAIVFGELNPGDYSYQVSFNN
jgi:peptidoglycan/xylan/chitin deacetylase (PgdA/CDA1 family)